jgi:hypothetical protein
MHMVKDCLCSLTVQSAVCIDFLQIVKMSCKRYAGQNQFVFSQKLRNESY